MKECNSSDVCENHGALITDIKWIKKLLYVILIFLSSSTVYFNDEINSKFTDLNNAILTNNDNYEERLVILEAKTIIMRDACCSELSVRKEIIGEPNGLAQLDSRKQN